MTLFETRYPCPVCLGVNMKKVQVPVGPTVGSTSMKAVAGRRGAKHELVLDHCTRCGGVWFDAGEVEQLRRVNAARLWQVVAQREGVHSSLCHDCMAVLPRNRTKCPACGWKAQLACPICRCVMSVSKQDGLRLDYCKRDKGVWFDHDELTGIWTMKAREIAKRRTRRPSQSTSLADALFTPDVFFYAPDAAANAAGLAVELAGSGAHVAGEALAQLASAVFEAVVAIICGIFDGL